MADKPEDKELISPKRPGVDRMTKTEGQLSLGDTIRHLRRQRGISQAELAGEGISPSYVSLVEAGKRTPSREVLVKIASRLGCDESDLLSHLEEPQSEELDLELGYAELMLADGKVDHALERFSVLVERSSREGQEAQRGVALWGLARSMERAARLEEAVRLYEQLAAQSAAHEHVDRIAVLIAVCRCYRELGDLGRAIDVGEQALTALQELDLLSTPEGIELVSTVVGLYSERGDMHRAGYLAELAVERASVVNNRKALGAAYWNASMVAYESGRTPDALRLVQRALALYSEDNNERALARLRIAQAAVLLQADPPQPKEAKALLLDALDALQRMGGSIDMAYARTELGRAALLLGHPEEAQVEAEQALEDLGTGHRLEAARATLIVAMARSQQGDEGGARETYERAALMLEASGASRQAARAWSELAEFLDARGDTERAVYAYRQGMRCLGHRPAAGTERLSQMARQGE
ncbi:helix-turn-helix domain-containing protein [Streptomyces sp. NPDC006372]|uniref:helix-turn-helix domain-containing protein n=1 Tax=Streptomyces sp. NPDC006372 TaxID=3155599 RepID=UPI0033A8A5ED